MNTPLNEMTLAMNKARGVEAPALPDSKCVPSMATVITFNETLRMALMKLLSGDLTKLPTYKAWRACRRKGICDPHSNAMIDWCFNVYLPMRHKHAVDAMCDVMDNNEQVAVTSYIGQLRALVDFPAIPEIANRPERKLGKVFIAKLLTSIAKDSGIFALEVKKTMTLTGEKNVEYLHFTKINFKDVLKGIHTEPGRVLQRKTGGRNHSPLGKKILRGYASQPLELHSSLDIDVLKHFHILKDDWSLTHDKNGRRLKWQGAYKRTHYEEQRESAMALKGVVYYQSWKFDHRLRIGPDAGRIDCINVHGKGYETEQHCSAIKHLINPENEKYLIQQLYCARHGRATVSKAVKMIRPKDYKPVTKDDFLSCTTQAQMNSLMIAMKALESLENMKSGTPDGNLFGLDGTFMGGQVAGCLFKSPQFCVSGNIYGRKTVFNNHANWLKILMEFAATSRQKRSFKIDLDESKDASQGMFHGEHISSYVIKLGKLGLKVTAEQLTGLLIKCYGSCFVNVDIISEWMKVLACSDYTRMPFTLPDGEVAIHQAYQSGIPISNHIPSALAMKNDGTPRHYQHVTQVIDLPYLTDNDGRALHPKKMYLGHTEFTTVYHLRGGYADIVHAYDAWFRRGVDQALWYHGYPSITKHDKYSSHINGMPIIIDTLRKRQSELIDGDYLAGNLQEIADKSPRYAVPPKIVYGKARNNIYMNEEVTNLLP